MSHHDTTTSKDFTKNWVNSSRFVFYLSIFAIIAFLTGACIKLHGVIYKGKPDVEIQSSTKFTPEYK